MNTGSQWNDILVFLCSLDKERGENEAMENAWVTKRRKMSVRCDVVRCP